MKGDQMASDQSTSTKTVLEQRPEGTDSEVPLFVHRSILQSIMESVPGFFVAFDGDHTPIYWNEDFRQVMADSDDESLQEKTLEDFFPAPDDDAIRAVMKRGTPQKTRLNVRTGNGRMESADVTLSPIRNFDRDVIGFVVTGEITDENTNSFVQDSSQSREATLNSILHTLPDVLYLIDEESNMIKWNDRMNELTGYSDHEISRMSPLDLIPEKDHDKITSTIEGVFKKQEIQRVNSRLVTKSGEEIPHEFIGGPLLDDHGEIMGLVGTGRDLRKRQEVETELKNQEQLFRSLVHAVEDFAIFRLTPEGQIKSWNRGAEEIKGYSREEIIGKHIAIFYPDEYLEENLAQRMLEEARQEGRAEHEGWRLRKDGSRFWAQVVITAIYEGNELIGFSKVTHDLTERKERKDELEERQEELESIQEQLEDRVETRTEELENFLYAVSHDLREPLRQIAHYTDFLRTDLEEEQNELSETVREDLEFLTDAAGRMQNLIKGLLRLSRIGRRDLSRETFDPEEAINCALKNLDQEVEKHDPDLIVQDLPPAHADRDLLTNLYQNLISNALKDSGSDSPTITLTGRSEDNRIVLGVQDDGQGIHSEHHDRIFEPFRQLQEWENQEGTGIGLSLCRRIVKRHGGSIWVESEPDRGAHFLFSLPREGTVNHGKR